MPMHTGLIPREGIKADVFARLFAKTVLNPLLTLPILLLARLTQRGQNLAILHSTALLRTQLLFYVGAARWLSSWYSARVLNNWTTDDGYDWRSREIVLVTGGSGGIGGHVVQLLAERGIKVVVRDIQPLTFSDTNVHYFKCDITNTKELAAVAKEIRAAVGDPTVLINNAGVARGKTVLDASERDVRFTFDVNTLAHYWIAKEFLPSLVKQNHGMVVTVASTASYLTAPNMVDYAASKVAALAFHEGLSAELPTRYGAPKVRTVVINQGYTRTPLFTGFNNSRGFLMPSLEPETVAEAIVRQVLSGKSGQVICPDFARLLPAVRTLPHWLQDGMRKDAAEILPQFRGRQVVQDLDEFYEAKEHGHEHGHEHEQDKGKDVGGSTVLVPEASS